MQKTTIIIMIMLGIIISEKIYHIQSLILFLFLFPLFLTYLLSSLCPSLISSYLTYLISSLLSSPLFFSSPPPFLLFLSLISLPTSQETNIHFLTTLKTYILRRTFMIGDGDAHVSPKGSKTSQKPQETKETNLNQVLGRVPRLQGVALVKDVNEQRHCCICSCRRESRNMSHLQSRV